MRGLHEQEIAELEKVARRKLRGSKPQVRKLVSAKEAKDRDPELPLSTARDDMDSYLLRLQETVLALWPSVEALAKRPCEQPVSSYGPMVRDWVQYDCDKCSTCQARERVKEAKHD